MSMQDYEAAVKLMQAFSDSMDFIGARTDDLARLAENALDLTFPPTYRRFLLEFGAGNFDSVEIYGLIDHNFATSAVPNGVWETLRKRVTAQLPNSYVIFYDLGHGEQYCLDTSRISDSGEAPVVVFVPGVPRESQPMNVIAQDFGQILLELVQEQVSRIVATDL